MRVIKKRLKSIIATVLALAISLCALAMPANAAFVDTGKFFLLNEGGFLGIGEKPYMYKIYKDNIMWAVMFPGKDICYPIYHVKNATAKTLSYERSAEYRSESAYAFASRWSVTASVEVIEAAVEKGFSRSYTQGLSVGTRAGVAAEIPITAPTGYYKMTICHNFEKYQFYKYDEMGEFISSDYYAALPIRTPYLAVLYSTSSDSGYTIYG